MASKTLTLLPTSISSAASISGEQQRIIHLHRRLPRRRPSHPRFTCSAAASNPLISLLSAVVDWADATKERRAGERRPLYTHREWQQHRSSRRHLRHLLSSLTSRVILSLVPPVAALTAVATVVAIYNSSVTSGWLPGVFPVLRASPLPYQLTAPALALLLVFRTEASYSRFVEGRKVWRMVISAAGELAGLVMAVNERGKGSDVVREALVKYIMAFPVALKCHIINGSDTRKDLQDLLDKDDVDVIISSEHRPRCVIEFISQCLQILDIDDHKRSIMESKVSCFYEGIGVCEQLIGIPIPLSYTRLTSRFLVLWHLTLPVILWDECKWIVVPATFISAASLFCIEEVGVLIEEPFPMLSLNELCKQLHGSIRDVISVQDSVRMRLLAKPKDHAGNHSCNGWLGSKGEPIHDG